VIIILNVGEYLNMKENFNEFVIVLSNNGRLKKAEKLCYITII